jgi:serine/threonine protein kinase
MLYELATGVVPYPAADALEATRRKVHTEPPLLRLLPPDAPLAVKAIVYRALRRRPAERYTTMAALAYDLEHLDEVVLPEKYEQDVPPARRPRRSAALAYHRADHGYHPGDSRGARRSCRSGPSEHLTLMTALTPKQLHLSWMDIWTL